MGREERKGKGRDIKERERKGKKALPALAAAHCTAAQLSSTPAGKGFSGANPYSTATTTALHSLARVVATARWDVFPPSTQPPP